jgi:hypothetical protein
MWWRPCGCLWRQDWRRWGTLSLFSIHVSFGFSNPDLIESVDPDQRRPKYTPEKEKRCFEELELSLEDCMLHLKHKSLIGVQNSIF